MKLVLKRCPLCGSPGIHRARVDRVYRIAGVERHVRGVEAQVCPHCGESFLDAVALEQIDRALGLKRRRRKPAHVA
jgi:YgiT-type zinc finger domain-containing protein